MVIYFYAVTLNLNQTGSYIDILFQERAVAAYCDILIVDMFQNVPLLFREIFDNQ